MWKYCINLHPVFMTPFLHIKSCDLNIVTRTMMWMLFKAVCFYIFNPSALNCLSLTPFHECGYSVLHTSHCLTTMLWTQSRESHRQILQKQVCPDLLEIKRTSASLPELKLQWQPLKETESTPPFLVSNSRKCVQFPTCCNRVTLWWKYSCDNSKNQYSTTELVHHKFDCQTFPYKPCYCQQHNRERY